MSNFFLLKPKNFGYILSTTFSCIQITYSLAIPNLNFFASIARKIATVLSLEKKEKVFNKVENFRLYFPGFAAPTLRKKNFFIWFRHP